MKNLEENIKSNKNGITLIALVITIIILLILAGVSIAMLTGQNGILSQAQNAKNKTEQAQKEEELILKDYEDMINGNYIEIKQVTDENPGVLEGNGTETDPYTINSIEDLVFFSYDVREGNNYENKIVNLGTSLDFNSDKSYVDANRTNYEKYGYDGNLKELLNSGNGFIPIGKYDTSKQDDEEVLRQNNFAGIFNGNNNIIKNLYINEIKENGAERIGLFADNFGTIKNLGLINVNINIKGKNMVVGGVSGATFGNIIGCSVTGEIKCHSTLWSMAGGITGNVKKSLQIAECSNSANITFNNEGETGQACVGGIVGNSNSDVNEYFEINKCYNSGKIYGYSEKNFVFLGGIAGTLYNGQIKNCYNTGIIEGKGTNTTYIGGIVGASNPNDEENINFYNLYNTGEIIFNGNIAENTAYIGGIMGYNYETTLTNIYNKGNIKVNSENTRYAIGGITAGAYRGKIYNGYNTGNIELVNVISDKIGSIIGRKMDITNSCYYLQGTYEKGIGALEYDNTDEGVEVLGSLSDFPDVLSVINSENAFKSDTNNINNGYPILNWQ